MIIKYLCFSYDHVGHWFELLFLQTLIDNMGILQNEIIWGFQETRKKKES